MESQIETGDRFEDQDPRQGNRVVRVTGEAIRMDRSVYGGNSTAPRFPYVVEVAELNPKTVGRKFYASEKTLRARYKRISR